jgi:deazaflavin-dependent oxidoreductase (nitroreductase family)
MGTIAIMADDWNRKIIDEFRANQGRVGGPFDGADMMLLHHTGAKTRATRVSPLVYLPVDGGMAIFASKGGAPTNPGWYHNLLANPQATVEVGTETFDVRAREVKGAERAPIWERQKQVRPAFADYERKTSRVIPVLILERVA